jgi:hypothetical protein
MYTVQVSAERLNQIRAALDDRREILSAQIARLEVQESSEDRDRALVWSIDALFETERARDDFSDLVAVPEPPVDATWRAWTPGELAEAFGR